MAENSKIEWCDNTFNPWVGCSRISPACDHCYAESWARRTGHPELWEGERRRTSAANWKQPLKWDAQARAVGRRVLLFCASLADVFDNAVPHEWRVDLFELIGKTTNIDWLLLTKRIGNAHRMLDEVMDTMSRGLQRWSEPITWPDLWLGVTIANQEEADRDIPKLLATPARVRFLSCEPLLGPIDLSGLLHRCPTHDFDSGFCIQDCGDWQWLNWVIAGGESGGKARPSHPDWFRSLRDQCAAAGVPYHFKQWGEYAPAADHDPKTCGLTPTAIHKVGWIEHRPSEAFSHLSLKRYGWAGMCRVGKKAAGRTLDGKVWDQFPVVQRC